MCVCVCTGVCVDVRMFEGVCGEHRQYDGTTKEGRVALCCEQYSPNIKGVRGRVLGPSASAVDTKHKTDNTTIARAV